MLGTTAVRRVLVAGALAMGLGFGTAVTAASSASAAGPPVGIGTCSLGGGSTTGAIGCVGNVGGGILLPNGTGLCLNETPFFGIDLCPPE